MASVGIMPTGAFKKRGFYEKNRIYRCRKYGNSNYQGNYGSE